MGVVLSIAFVHKADDALMRRIYCRQGAIFVVASAAIAAIAVVEQSDGTSTTTEFGLRIAFAVLTTLAAAFSFRVMTHLEPRDALVCLMLFVLRLVASLGLAAAFLANGFPSYKEEVSSAIQIAISIAFMYVSFMGWSRIRSWKRGKGASAATSPGTLPALTASTAAHSHSPSGVSAHACSAGGVRVRGGRSRHTVYGGLGPHAGARAGASCVECETSVACYSLVAARHTARPAKPPNPVRLMPTPRAPPASAAVGWSSTQRKRGCSIQHRATLRMTPAESVLIQRLAQVHGKV